MKTTVNGKEIKVFGRNDISIVFTQKVNEMLSQGFVFCFDRGAQGEEGKVCLTNDGGKTVYVFYVYKEYESITENRWDRSRVIYIIGEKFVKRFPDDTLWLGKGEKFYEAKWFCIDERKDVYVENVQFAKEISEIESVRFDRKLKSRDETVTFYDRKKFEIAVSILNKRDGYKSLKVRHVAKIEKRNDSKYYVYFEKKGKVHIVSL